MATVAAKDIIQIKPLKIEKLKIRIVGDSPLIVHAWSEKAKKEMLGAQQGEKTPKGKKPYRLPFDEYARSLYWLTPMPTVEWKDPLTNKVREIVTEELFEEAINNGARFGFPANAFKMCANSAAVRGKYVPDKMGLRAAYFINAKNGGELVEIEGSIPLWREDMVKLQGSTADLRYRGAFPDWHCDMILEYNANGSIPKSDIINYLNYGGYGVGIGEWRPERDGQFGRFHVEILQ